MLGLVHSKNRPPVHDHSKTIMAQNISLQRIIQGNTLAFLAFDKIYFSRLFCFILLITHSPDSVDELIQETLLAVWKTPCRVNQENKISTRMFGIGYHKALKWIPNNTCRNNQVDADELVEALNDRTVIELTFRYDLQYQEIAKILGYPENTVQTQMIHAKNDFQFFAETERA